MSLKIFASNTAAKVLSIVFAAILWFHVATNEVYHYKVDIPIKYIEPSSGYMLASAPPGKIQIYLSGTGKQLLYFTLRSVLDPEASYISVNLAGYPKGRHKISLQKEDIFLPTEEGITVESILYNAFFSLVIDKKISQTVPVDVDSLPQTNVEAGYIIVGKPTVDPEYVIVDGPEDVVSPLKGIRVSSLSVSRIAHGDTLVGGFLKSPDPFVTLNQSDVQIHFNIEPIRTKLFQGVPVSFRDFPRRYEGILAPDTLSVFIQGPESVVSQSRKEDITVSVTYRDFRSVSSNGDSTMMPKVNYPDGLTSVKTTPGVLRIVNDSPDS